MIRRKNTAVKMLKRKYAGAALKAEEIEVRGRSAEREGRGPPLLGWGPRGEGEIAALPL